MKKTTPPAQSGQKKTAYVGFVLAFMLIAFNVPDNGPQFDDIAHWSNLLFAGGVLLFIGCVIVLNKKDRTVAHSPDCVNEHCECDKHANSNANENKQPHPYPEY